MFNYDNKTIVFTGGGTGGHIWPLVTIVRWAKKNMGIRPIYFGTGSALERRVWRKEGVRQYTIPSGKRRNYFALSNFIDAIILPFGVLKALVWLWIVKPAFVFGKGGYGMVPAAAAARILDIPVVSHESDIVMGKTNKWLLNRGGLVLTAFPRNEYGDIKNENIRYAGMPIHPRYFETNNKKTEGRIVIFGGSQGSVRINTCVKDVWEQLANLASIVHVVGAYDYKRMQSERDKLPEIIRRRVEIVKETDSLPDIIGGAKMVIGRGGATSLWEMAYSEVPSIVIPLPESAGDHQRLNSIYMSREFPWIKVLEENELTSEKLLQMVKSATRVASSDVQSTDLIMPKEAVEEVGAAMSELMDESFLLRRRRIHLVGINGVSMAGIAHILRLQGHIVSGSDLTIAGHNAANIKKNIDAVVFSSAASDKKAPGFVEIERARRLKIPVFKRSVFISTLLGVSRIVAVSGMHGKSTVASMITFILKEAGLAPKYLIGVPSDRSFPGVGAAGWGKGFTAVVEACEYDRSFCDIRPDIAVVTNIEEEHLDYFRGGMREIEKTFIDFIDGSRFGSTLIISPQPAVQKVAHNVLDIRTDVSLVKTGIAGGVNWQDYQFFGKHNQLNASLAVSACAALGVDKEKSWEILRRFRGAKRRMEYIGEFNSNPVYDDYGHHPTEIKAVLDAVRNKYPDKKIMIIFQPHQVSRTRAFYDDFVEALSLSDNVIITDIYEVAGREKGADISAQGIADKINSKTLNKAKFIPLPYENIERHIRNMTDFKGVIITIGATDIYKVAYALTGKISKS